MAGINVKQAKRFMDAINNNEFWYLKLKEHEMIDKVLETVEQNKKYEEIGKEITAYAQKIVDEMKEDADKVRASINVITMAIKEAYTAIEWKKKPSIKEKKRIEELNKQYKEKWEELDKMYQDANAKLEEFRKQKIDNEYMTLVLFDLDEAVYDLIDSKITWSVYSWDNYLLKSNEEKNEETN